MRSRRRTFLLKTVFERVKKNYFEFSKNNFATISDHLGIYPDAAHPLILSDCSLIFFAFALLSLGLGRLKVVKKP